MNNAPSSTEHPQSVVTEEDLKYSPIGYLSFWPAIVLGLLICMGIMGLLPTFTLPGLGWLPLLILGALLILAIVTMPRARKPKEEPWERRARELAEAKALAQGSDEAAPDDASVAPAAAETVEEAPLAAVAPVVAGDVDVLVLWGSETGTAQGLAEMTETRIKDAGLSARAVSMAAVKASHLAGFAKVLVITSTWGDGEPPSNGIDLWEALQKEKVDLSKTGFSVLALGDTAYPLFCKCGKDFDEFLAKQGGQRLFSRVDCDLNYEANYDKWLKGVLSALGK